MALTMNCSAPSPLAEPTTTSQKLVGHMSPHERFASVCTSLMNFKTSDMEKQFHCYKAKNASYGLLLIMVLLVSTLFGLFAPACVSANASSPLAVPLMILAAFSLMCDYALVYVRHVRLEVIWAQRSFAPLCLLEALVMASNCATCALILFYRLANGVTSDPSNWYRSLGSAPASSDGLRLLPADSVLALLFFPLLFKLSLPLAQWDAVLSIYAMCVAWVCGLLLHFRMLPCGAVLLGVAMLVSAMALFAHRKENVVLFLAALTDREVYEERMRSKADEASHYARQLRNMIAGVAHDLTSPLTALAQGIDTISATIASPSSTTAETLAAVRCTLRGMRFSQQTMLMIINRCVDYHRVSHGLPLVQRSDSLCLGDVMLQAVRAVQDVQSEVAVVQEVRQEGLLRSCVRTDQQWLLDNLLCLLTNAVKYSPRGSTVTVRALLVTPLEVRIEVEDEGDGVAAGIDPASLFESAPRSSQHMTGGIGMGLFVLSCRTKALGGSCGYRRGRGGKGAVFWFQIPFLLLHQPAAAACSSSGVRSALRILLVDDSLSILKMCRMMLQQAGHEVRTAVNGQVALQMMHEQRFDVVLMDLQMPVLDGLQAVRLYRQSNDQDRKMAIIGVSASCDHATTAEALHAGMDAFLAKPFDMAKLDNVLSRCHNPDNDGIAAL